MLNGKYGVKNLKLINMFKISFVMVLSFFISVIVISQVKKNYDLNNKAKTSDYGSTANQRSTNSKTSQINNSFANSFISPPNIYKPWVYWYFNEGNITREGITRDLEEMKKANIGGAIFLEINIGLPPGKVAYMSVEWQNLLKYAFAEAKRLGVEIALGSGPGWCGTGGPWISAENSMQHLVSSEMQINGPVTIDTILPKPFPKLPIFGKESLDGVTDSLWKNFYEDEYLVAYPSPQKDLRIKDLNEKAFFYRAPYSSVVNVRSFLDAPADYKMVSQTEGISSDSIIDITTQLKSNGRLKWNVPKGKWIIMRFGRTITGQLTRPAPIAGLGLETNKFERSALDAHFKYFLYKIVDSIEYNKDSGLTTLHFDSWEMGAQNWSQHFRSEFLKRRKYDLFKYLPVMSGKIVSNVEISERFLWDLRQTSQELIVENQVGYLKEYAHKRNLNFSEEFYDMSPSADLYLGSIADIPSGEFWSTGYGFPTGFSVIEAASLGHVMGKKIIASEAFTALGTEEWRQNPGSMKAQTDWAFANGINRLVIHRWAHQPVPGKFPGFTMGPFGVHWEYTQTWWDMVPNYHKYVSRCQEMLRFGLPVADILFVTPEGAPMVFHPPHSALTDVTLDRKGYNFDGCSPDILIKNAFVKDGRIAFPGGMSYKILVLPRFQTMTPILLSKIKDLLKNGALIIGALPKKSPSLVDYPSCDLEVKRIASELWGKKNEKVRKIKKGTLYLDENDSYDTAWSKNIYKFSDAGTQAFNFNKVQDSFPDIFPEYKVIAEILEKNGITEDFQSDGDHLRYCHRQSGDTDIYFIANKENKIVDVNATFRVREKQPEWWNPLTGEHRDLSQFTSKEGVTTIPIKLQAFESGFILFSKKHIIHNNNTKNFPSLKLVKVVNGLWDVSFDTSRGGPSKVIFDNLYDWSKRAEPGIKYYSGKAQYKTSFNMEENFENNKKQPFLIALGNVKIAAIVRINGKDIGTVWSIPWILKIPKGILKKSNNSLEVTVANLWINRLIGDVNLPESKKIAWTTWNPFTKNSHLEESGLLGPVKIFSIQ